MNDDYVRYADWLTFSWIIMLSGLAIDVVGLLGIGNSMLAIDPAGPPFTVAVAKVAAGMTPAVIFVFGLSITIYGANVRDRAEGLRPDGLEVPA